ncbi:hypothetical protein Tco_0319386 [Tanacetum coccineum]
MTTSIDSSRAVGQFCSVFSFDPIRLLTKEVGAFEAEQQRFRVILLHLFKLALNRTLGEGVRAMGRSDDSGRHSSWVEARRGEIEVCDASDNAIDILTSQQGGKDAEECTLEMAIEVSETSVHQIELDQSVYNLGYQDAKVGHMFCGRAYRVATRRVGRVEAVLRNHKEWTSQQKEEVFRDIKHYFWDEPYLLRRTCARSQDSLKD